MYVYRVPGCMQLSRAICMDKTTDVTHYLMTWIQYWYGGHILI